MCNLCLNESIQGILDTDDPAPTFIKSEVSVTLNFRCGIIVQVTVEENNVVTMETVDPDPTPPVYIMQFCCVFDCMYCQANPPEFPETLTLTRSKVFYVKEYILKFCTGCVECYWCQQYSLYAGWGHTFDGIN